MKRILFVDDEPHVLEGLRDLLRSRRNKWEMVFACGAETALKVLDEQPFDVIVSDLRMPGIYGLTFLWRVQEDYPDTIRIVLSGHAELDTALRAIRVAHQFLCKPCNADVLENAIERACNLNALIGDDTVRRLVGRASHLASTPRVFAALSRALVNQNLAPDEVAGILNQDMRVSAGLLRLVNSGLFTPARPITGVEDAVLCLGSDTVKNLVLCVEAFQAAEGRSGAGDLSVESLQRHGLLTANIASRIVTGKAQAEDAFIAGILHDIGKLVLSMQRPERLDEALAAARQDGRPPYVVEQEVAGASHAEAGAHLLGIWRLPYPVVEAVANHHLPYRVQQQSFDVLAAVHVADLLVHEAEAFATGGKTRGYDAIDVAYLERLGVADRLASWRAIAAEQLQHQGAGEKAASE
jgi:putative nucleotidyltransferase with HDIG domain